jgi:hypothetical protein
MTNAADHCRLRIADWNLAEITPAFVNHPGARQAPRPSVSLVNHPGGSSITLDTRQAPRQSTIAGNRQSPAIDNRQSAMDGRNRQSSIVSEFMLGAGASGRRDGARRRIQERRSR